MRSAASSLAPPIINRGDLSDRLNPILIKEIIQGTRSRFFVLPFIIVQLFLVSFVILSLLRLQAGMNNAHLAELLYWGSLSFASLVILPFRAFGGVMGEARRGTLDLLFTTSLSGTSIVWGKWAAIMSQVLLLMIAAIPYLILRYFIGQTELVSDLMRLLLLFLASGMITALALFCSSFSYATSVFITVLIGAGFLLSGLPLFLPLLLIGVAGINQLLGYIIADAILFLAILCLLAASAACIDRASPMRRGRKKLSRAPAPPVLTGTQPA